MTTSCTLGQKGKALDCSITYSLGVLTAGPKRPRKSPLSELSSKVKPISSLLRPLSPLSPLSPWSPLHHCLSLYRLSYPSHAWCREKLDLCKNALKFTEFPQIVARFFEKTSNAHKPLVATASQLVSKKVCHCSVVSVPNRKDRKDQMPSWAVSTANWLMQLIPPSLTGSSPLLDETFSLSTSSCHGFTQEPGAKTLGKIILIYGYVYIIYYVIFLYISMFDIFSVFGRMICQLALHCAMLC